MKHLIISSAILVLAMVIQAQDHGILYRFSKEADMIFSPGTTVDLVADSFTFAEGPVWSPDGYLLFSDVPENAVLDLPDLDSVFEAPILLDKQKLSHLMENYLQIRFEDPNWRDLESLIDRINKKKSKIIIGVPGKYTDQTDSYP